MQKKDYEKETEKPGASEYSFWGKPMFAQLNNN
jgi:hypothetical protein